MAIFLRRLKKQQNGYEFLEAVKSTPIKSAYTYFPVKHYSSWTMIESRSGISASIGFKKSKKELLNSFDAKEIDKIINRIQDVYISECIRMDNLKLETAKQLGCSIEELGDVLWQKQLTEKNGQQE